MLNAHLVSQVVSPRRDIADGPDVRRTGTAGGIAHHAVVHIDSCAVEPLGGGVRSDADHDEIGIEFGAVAEHHLLHLLCSPDLGNADPAPHVHPFRAVQPCDQRSDLLAQHRGQRRWLRLDQDDIDAEPAQARGHLTADEPRADHDRVPRRRGPLAQGEALVDRAQDVDTLDVRERRNALGHQACCDHQLVVAELAAVGQRDRLRGDVDGPCPLTEQHGDVVLVVELRGLERDVIGLTAQDFLGQRRPVVRQVVLVAEDGDRAGVLRPAQLLSGARRGQPAPDDHDSPTGAHGQFLHDAHIDLSATPLSCGPGR